VMVSARLIHAGASAHAHISHSARLSDRRRLMAVLYLLDAVVIVMMPNAYPK